MSDTLTALMSFSSAHVTFFLKTESCDLKIHHGRWGADEEEALRRVPTLLAPSRISLRMRARRRYSD